MGSESYGQVASPTYAPPSFTPYICEQIVRLQSTHERTLPPACWWCRKAWLAKKSGEPHKPRYVWDDVIPWEKHTIHVPAGRKWLEQEHGPYRGPTNHHAPPGSMPG